MPKRLMLLPLTSLLLIGACETGNIEPDRARSPIAQTGDGVPSRPTPGASAAAGGQGGGAGESTADGGRAGASDERGGQGGVGGSEPYDPSDPTCPTTLLGPPMVLLRSPAGVPYCIDQHEVRQKDYAPFVEAATKDAGGIKKLACGENVKWTVMQEEFHQKPGLETYTGCGEPGTWNPEKHGEWPKTCVDECAAKAFCTFAGKELCGAVGGGELKFTDDGYLDLDPENNAWFNACSNGGKTLLPRGNERKEATCEQAILDPATPAAAEPAECRSSEPPFGSMIGLGTGVREYVNACTGANGTNCAIAGPSLDPYSPGQSVAPQYVAPHHKECGEVGLISSGGDGIGFRCCKPLP